MAVTRLTSRLLAQTFCDPLRESAVSFFVCIEGILFVKTVFYFGVFFYFYLTLCVLILCFLCFLLFFSQYPDFSGAGPAF